MNMPGNKTQQGERTVLFDMAKRSLEAEMSKSRKVDLGAVQETLLIPLWARAFETRRAEPLLRDAKAAELVTAIDYDFGKFAKGKASQVGCCLRASVIDGWVRKFLARHPRGMIVEIGVGLDTRFERAGSSESQWFELDLPDVIELRSRFFQETPRRRFIRQSVLSTDWIAEVEAASQPVMFVAEGVVMYFEEEQVKGLFSMLADHFPGSALAFDALSPLMVRMQKRHDTISQTSAVFRWGIEDVVEIEGWDSRCTIEESVRFHDLAKRHIRRFPLKMRASWFFWPAMRRGYGIHLARLGSPAERTNDR
jgi:O-methyltransferase involved in polyketide biosynthesis